MYNYELPPEFFPRYPLQLLIYKFLQQQEYLYHWHVNTDPHKHLRIGLALKSHLNGRNLYQVQNHVMGWNNPLLFRRLKGENIFLIFGAAK